LVIGAGEALIAVLFVLLIVAKAGLIVFFVRRNRR
jgi:hypothetical protein